MGAPGTHAEASSLSGGTTISDLHSIILTAGVDAAEIRVREVNAGGAPKIHIKALAGTTVNVPFTCPCRVQTPIAGPPGSVWYVEVVAGTTPTWTLVGA